MMLGRTGSEGMGSWKKEKRKRRKKKMEKTRKGRWVLVFGHGEG
jgi:hypothetical protein